MTSLHPRSTAQILPQVPTFVPVRETRTSREFEDLDFWSIEKLAPAKNGISSSFFFFFFVRLVMPSCSAWFQFAFWNVKSSLLQWTFEVLSDFCSKTRHCAASWWNISLGPWENRSNAECCCIFCWSRLRSYLLRRRIRIVLSFCFD